LQKKIGRPPKNMCKACQGWGAVFVQEATLVLFGSGEVKEELTQTAPAKQDCTDCSGTGYTGGKMQQGQPPILSQWDAQKAAVKEIKEHVEHNKRVEERASGDIDMYGLGNAELLPTDFTVLADNKDGELQV